jgi:hypothetical protein
VREHLEAGPFIHPSDSLGAGLLVQACVPCSSTHSRWSGSASRLSLTCTAYEVRMYNFACGLRGDLLLPDEIDASLLHLQQLR